jgi:hypothetical protein
VIQESILKEYNEFLSCTFIPPWSDSRKSGIYRLGKFAIQWEYQFGGDIIFSFMDESGEDMSGVGIRFTLVESNVHSSQTEYEWNNLARTFSMPPAHSTIKFFYRNNNQRSTVR